MNQFENHAPESRSPMQVDVKIHTLHTSGSVLARLAALEDLGHFLTVGVQHRVVELLPELLGAGEADVACSPPSGSSPPRTASPAPCR